MKLSNAKPLVHLRWLAVLVPFVAGMWCVSGVSVQASASDDVVADDDSVSENITVELETNEIINPQLEAYSDQLIITKRHCRTFPPVHISARDEVWLVSARGSHCLPCDLTKLSCCWLQNGIWQDSSLDELVARHSSDKGRATMIYVHGNRTDLCFAQVRGLQVYQAALQDSPCPRPPIRFVMFAWKSEKEILLPVTDFGIKSDRAVSVGKTLAQFLGQFEDRNLAIVGFSLGTQVILSGLSCVEQHETNDGLGKYRVALIAPALDPGFVRTSFCSYPHNPLVEQTSVFLNRNDRAIQVAQFIVRRRSHSSVTTLHQLAGSRKMSLNPIRIHDITREVSKRHAVTRYATSRSIRAGLAQMANDVQTSSGVPFPSEALLTPPALDRVVVPTH